MTDEERGAKIGFLGRYHGIAGKITRKKDYIAFMGKMASQPSGVSYDRVLVDRTPSANPPFAIYVELRLRAERELEALTDSLDAVGKEITDTVGRLEDEHEQSVLLCRYMDWMTWEDIAGRLYVSVSTAKRWHNAALGHLEIPPESGKNSDSEKLDRREPL